MADGGNIDIHITPDNVDRAPTNGGDVNFNCGPGAYGGEFGTFRWFAGGREALSLTPDGKFRMHGEVVESERLVYASFKAWLVNATMDVHGGSAVQLPRPDLAAASRAFLEVSDEPGGSCTCGIVRGRAASHLPRCRWEAARQLLLIELKASGEEPKPPEPELEPPAS